MDAKDRKQAICFGDAKQPALFFDRVLPLTLDEILPASSVRYGVREVSQHQNQRAQRIFQSLLGPRQQQVLFSRSEMLRTIHTIFASNSQGNHTFSEYMAENYLYDGKVLSGVSLRETLNPLIESLGFSKAPIVFPETMLLREGAGEDDSVTIYNLPLVDAEQASWEQIIELRNDTTRAAKLRNLRLFFETTFHGKGKSFIEDALDKAIEDYHKTLSEHGFKTKIGAWSLLFSKESAFGYGVAALLANLFGLPITALSAGAVLNIANVSIYVASRKYEFKLLKDSHDVAYLVDTKNRLGACPEK